MSANLSVRLGDPKPQRPSPRHRLSAVTRTTQSFFNRLSNTGRAWQVNEVNLLVTQGTQDFQLAVDGNFGKPLQVITIDPSNPAHITRSIDFFEVQNLNFDWGLPQNYGTFNWSPDGSQHTALRMAFYRKDDGIWVRIQPMPMLTCTYTILYTIGNWIDTAALETSPVLSEHHHLIETIAGMSLLPMCEWGDDPKVNAATRAEFRQSLDMDRQTYMPDFEMYIRSLTKSKLSNRVSFGDW